MAFEPPPPPSLHISQAKYIVKAIISSSYFHVSSPFQTTRGVLCDSSKWLSNKDFLDPGDERASLAYWPLPDQCHLRHFSQVICVTMAKFSIETTFMKLCSKDWNNVTFIILSVLSSLLVLTLAPKPSTHQTQVSTRYVAYHRIA